MSVLYLLHFIRMELQEAQKIANERKREKMEERLARWVTRLFFVGLMFV